MRSEHPRGVMARSPPGALWNVITSAVHPGGAPRWPSWTPFTYPFNMTHQPAATVPCGFSAAGLPIGVQVVGRRHADSLVLSACAAIEAALPWRDRWPG